MTLLDYKEASQFLRISEITLRKKCMLGKVPHLKPFGKHGRTLFLREDLERLLLTSRRGELSTTN